MASLGTEGTTPTSKVVIFFSLQLPTGIHTLIDPLFITSALSVCLLLLLLFAPLTSLS